MLDFGSTLLFVFTIVVAVGILIYMRHVRSRVVNLPRVIDRAVEQSTFRPTVFKIYDKSSETVCDRLIVVEPFDWYVWACRGQLFVLNPEGGSLKCQAGTTPAVRVLEKQFYETCVNLDLDTLLRGYTTTGVYKEVPYRIEGTTFTILSALNILCKDWITFEKLDDPSSSVTTIRTRRSTESLALRFDPTYKSHSELLKHYKLHSSNDNDDNDASSSFPRRPRLRLKEKIKKEETNDRMPVISSRS